MDEVVLWMVEVVLTIDELLTFSLRWFCGWEFHAEFTSFPVDIAWSIQPI
jgi:hypothetical protein